MTLKLLFKFRTSKDNLIALEKFKTKFNKEKKTCDLRSLIVTQLTSLHGLSTFVHGV